MPELDGVEVIVALNVGVGGKVSVLGAVWEEVCSRDSVGVGALPVFVI